METDTTQPENSKKRAALYLRVSTEEQGKEGHYGLEVQEERGRSFCQSQEYILAEQHIYRDEKSGGLGVEQRPGLKELFEAAKRQEFDVVVVYKTDRLARNLRVLVNAIHNLEMLSVAFRSVTEPFDTTTSFGRANLNLFGTFAEFEKEMIRERTMNGRVKAAKTGKWVGSVPPYGYVLDKTTRRLVINPKEAKIVKQIFIWLVDNKLPVHEIERRLNAMKVPAPWSKKIKTKETFNVWRKYTIIRILVNEVHTGTFYYRKYKKPFNGLTSITDKARLRPKAEWIEMKTDPIISREMYEDAKQQLAHNREFARRNQKRQYLYSKIIYCSQCDHKMFGGFQPPKKRWEYEGGRYYHGTYRKFDALGTTARCDWCPNYSEARLEPIWECLKEILKNPRNMTRPLEKYIHKENDPVPIKQRLEQIDEALEILRKKRTRVDDLYISEQLAEKQYKDYHAEFKIDEQKLNDEATHLRQSLLSKEEISERQKAIAKAYEKIKARLESVTYEEKVRIVSLFVQRVILHAKEDYAEVVFKFPGHTDTTGSKGTPLKPKDFPLVLKIRTVTETERKAFILRNNPGMYVPKTLV